MNKPYDLQGQIQSKKKEDEETSHLMKNQLPKKIRSFEHDEGREIKKGMIIDEEKIKQPYSQPLLNPLEYAETIQYRSPKDDFTAEIYPAYQNPSKVAEKSEKRGSSINSGNNSENALPRKSVNQSRVNMDEFK